MGPEDNQRLRRKTEESMSKGIGSVQVKKQRGKPTLFVYGQTPRGQLYIKGHKEINASESDRKKFKAQIGQLVMAFFEEGDTPE